MSKLYEKILVPYDGSKYSQKALEMAAKMADAFDSLIYLVNVVDVSTVSPPGWSLSQGTRRTIDQIKDSVKVSTESHLQKIQGKYKDLVIKGFVLEGDPVSKMLKFIQEKDIDLVIIGSKGLSGISKIMTLGSISRKISELAKCPVTIVR